MYFEAEGSHDGLTSSICVAGDVWRHKYVPSRVVAWWDVYLFSSAWSLSSRLCCRQTQPAFLADCFQTHKDHSAPNLTPKILFTPPWLDLPLCGSLLLRKQVACWINPKHPDCPAPPRDPAWGGLAFPVCTDKLHVCTHTERKPVNTLPNPQSTEQNTNRFFWFLDALRGKTRL